jgi:hypothetical protein
VIVEIVLERVDLGVQPPKLSVVSVGRLAHVEGRETPIQALSRTSHRLALPPGLSKPGADYRIEARLSHKLPKRIGSHELTSV